MEQDIERELELLWLALAEERQVVSMKTQVIASQQETIKSLQEKLTAVANERDALLQKSQAAPQQLHVSHQMVTSNASSSTATPPESDDEDDSPDASRKPANPHTPVHDHGQSSLRDVTTSLRIEVDRQSARLRALAIEKSASNMQALFSMQAMEDHGRCILQSCESSSRDLLAQACLLSLPSVQSLPEQVVTWNSDRGNSDSAVFDASHRWQGQLHDLVAEVSKLKANLFSSSVLGLAAKTVSVADHSVRAKHDAVLGSHLHTSEQLADALGWAHWRAATDELRAARDALQSRHLPALLRRAQTWFWQVSHLHDSVRSAKDRFIGETLLSPSHRAADVASWDPSPSQRPRDEDFRYRLRALEERAAEKTRTIVKQAKELDDLRERLATASLTDKHGVVAHGGPAATCDLSVLEALVTDAKSAIGNAMCEFVDVLRQHAIDQIPHEGETDTRPLSVLVREVLETPASDSPKLAVDVNEMMLANMTRQWTAYTATSWLQIHHDFGEELRDQLALLAENHFAEAPVSKSMENVRADIAERSLGLVEAQRDQAASVANWMHNEATSAVRTLSGLVSRVDKVLTQKQAVEKQVRPSHPVEELESQRKAREVEKSTQRSVTQFGSICDSLLDHAARVHARLVESEHEVALLKRSAAESGSQGSEFREAALRSSLSHRLERIASDDALQLLQAHLTAERGQALRGLKIVGAGVAKRNIAIFELQDAVQRYSVEARGNLATAQLCWLAYEHVLDELYAAFRRELIKQRLRDLPSPHEVQHIFLVVHAELGVALEEAAAQVRSSMRVAFESIRRLHGLEMQHKAEMLAASSELINLSRQRRLEQEAVQFAQQHSLVVASEAIWDFREMTASVFVEIQLALTAAVSARLIAEVAREKAETTENAARREFDSLREQRDTHLSERQAAEAQVTELGLRLQELSGSATTSSEALKAAQDDVNTLSSTVAELRTSQDTLSQLLVAEKQARALSKSSEEALERELADIKLRASAADEARKKAETDLAREKESHRATIRSMSQR